MTVNELIFEINHTYNLNKFKKALIITYIKEQDKKIEDLQTRINKAVEYIKWNLDKNEELIEYFDYDANFNELLNILRGDE